MHGALLVGIHLVEGRDVVDNSLERSLDDGETELEVCDGMFELVEGKEEVFSLGGGDGYGRAAVAKDAGAELGAFEGAQA